MRTRRTTAWGGRSPSFVTAAAPWPAGLPERNQPTGETGTRATCSHDGAFGPRLLGEPRARAMRRRCTPTGPSPTTAGNIVALGAIPHREERPPEAGGPAARAAGGKRCPAFF